MSYILKYKIGNVNAKCGNKDPKKLRELIKQIEQSDEEVDWELYNDGGIMLDSKKEQDDEKKKK